MSRTLAAFALLLLLVAPAHADDAGDVTKAFGTFIDGVVTTKGDTTGLDLFITPDGDERDDDGYSVPVSTDLDAARAMIGSSKLKVTKVVVTKGAKSAWIAGEITGKVKRKSKVKTEPIRVSAFLFKDAKGWHVQATHWSVGEPDQKMENCGMLDPWRPVPRVSKDSLPTVKAVFTSLEGDMGTVKTSKFGALLSDDKNALAIGSAPKELFAGGAKIKGVFKKWQISAMRPSGDKVDARAQLGPDGELMWIAMGITAPEQLCTSYRTLFVLAKEKAGWRIVHHHYSQPMNPY